MRAWLLNESPGTWQLGSVETPQPGPDDVQVRVASFALNHLDLWIAAGKPKPPTFPHIGGADGVGVVTVVGENVTTFGVGDEVVFDPAMSCGVCEHCVRGDITFCNAFGILGEHRPGTFGDYVVVPSRNVAHRPQERDWQTCAAFGLTYMTAHRMLERGRVGPGDQVLITGAGGGVSTAAVVLANTRGAIVSVSSRSPEKRRRALALGATEGFDPNALPQDAFDVVLDSVGGPLWPASLRALHVGGRFVTCGATGGANVELSLPMLFWSQYELIGSTMGTHADFAAVLELVRGGLTVPIDSSYEFGGLPRALERLGAGEQFGKLVITHSD